MAGDDPFFTLFEKHKMPSPPHQWLPTKPNITVIRDHVMPFYGFHDITAEESVFHLALFFPLIGLADSSSPLFMYFPRNPSTGNFHLVFGAPVSRRFSKIHSIENPRNCLARNPETPVWPSPSTKNSLTRAGKSSFATGVVVRCASHPPIPPMFQRGKFPAVPAFISDCYVSAYHEGSCKF